jgi:acetyl esterase/lipase
MMGDKDSNRVYCSVLAARGYTVVSLNYRLCPDVLYPSQVQDIMDAFKWVNNNGADYFCDLTRVYVTGDSAGGNLAYYVPLVNTSEKLCELYEVEPSGLQIDALGLVSGMYDMKNGFNGPIISCFFGFDYKNSPYYDYLQPEEVLDLGKLPPSYIVTCARDFLHASGVSFDEILTEKGIEHQFRDWGMSINRSSGHITSVAYPELEESQQTIDEMLKFFEEHTNVEQ